MNVENENLDFDNELDKPIDGNNLNHQLNPNQSLAVIKEQTLESIAEILNKVQNGEDTENPIILGVKNGKPIAIKCTFDKDGNIVLPDTTPLSMKDIKRKKRIVKNIISLSKSVLERDIKQVTETALMRKDEILLKQMEKKLKNPKSKPRLKNKIGCIWFEIDDLETVI